MKSFSEMFNPSISLIDRSRTIKCPPVDVMILDPMPNWTKSERFENLCYQRYDELISFLDKRNDKKLLIFYSGGIDSTLIVALAIAHPRFHEHKHRIFIAYNEESIKENPRFWHNFIIKKFSGRLIGSLGYHRYIRDENYLCVTGEFADNIFGSLTLKSYMDNTGDFDAIHKNFDITGLPWLLNKIKEKKHVDTCREMIEKIIATSPKTLESNHDCFWWLNFVLKWQAVKFRLCSHSPTANGVGIMASNVLHFFETVHFQNWAVMSDETKVENDWYSYKLPAKKMIYSINHDEYYFKWKTKYPSIPGITRYSNTHDFIYFDEKTQRFFAYKHIMNGNQE